MRFWSNAPKCVESLATAVEPSPHRGLLASGEGGVGDLDGDLPCRFRGEVAAAGVADLVLALSVLAGGDRADPGVGAVPVDRQQQPFGQHMLRQAAPACHRSSSLQAAGAEHCFLEHVDQRHRAPPGLHRLLQPAKVPWLWRGVEWVSLIAPVARSLISSQSQAGSTSCRASSSLRISSRSSSMNAVASRGLRSAW